MPDIVIRPMRSDELDLAAEMRERMTRELQGSTNREPDLVTRQRFVDFYRTRLADGSSATYVAQKDGALCAMASVYKLVNHRSEIFRQSSAYVSNVYVTPEFRRQGLGTALTQMCVDWARTKGCVIVRLRTSAMGRAVYAAMGFTQSDEMELPLINSP